MARLEGKVALITGAASGIGKASAIRFAGEGAAVVVADLNAVGGEEVAALCCQGGGRALFQRTDVTQEDEIQAAIARAEREFGRLDIYFNNAGVVGAIGPLNELDAADWDRTMAILLRAAFLGIKHAVEPMRRVGGGAIISTASVAGLRATDGPTAYSVAKAGVIHLTKCAARELGKDNIRVNCICPGGIVTPMLFGRAPGGEELVGKFLARAQPLARAGQPEDVAAMALFLASDESAWITGAAMVVDGGLTTGGKTRTGSAMGAALNTRRWAGPSFDP